MYCMAFLRKIAIYMYVILVRSVIIICHCVQLTWGSVVWDMWALLYGTTFLALTPIQTSASLFSLEDLKQQYVIIEVMYRMCCWYIITGTVILSYFFSVAPFAPLLKFTCYMWNRQGAHKSHRNSSSLCSHDNAVLYLYWYLYFMLIWPWCMLYDVWWEAIKLFWIFWKIKAGSSRYF